MAGGSPRSARWRRTRSARPRSAQGNDPLRGRRLGSADAAGDAMAGAVTWPRPAGTPAGAKCAELIGWTSVADSESGSGGVRWIPRRCRSETPTGSDRPRYPARGARRPQRNYDRSKAIAAMDVVASDRGLRMRGRRPHRARDWDGWPPADAETLNAIHSCRTRRTPLGWKRRTSVRCTLLPMNAETVFAEANWRSLYAARR